MLDVRAILKDLGIQFFEGGYNLRAKCWNPDHIDSNPSMRIHVETGVFHCFGCGYKGNILSLARKQLGSEYYYTHRHAVDTSKQDKTEEEVFTHLKHHLSKRASHNSTLAVKELPVVPAHNNAYLISRGVTEEQIDFWGIGVVKTTDASYLMYNNWIYIPIFFQHTLRTWFLRSPYANRKLYGYYTDEKGKPIGYPRSDLLFGFDWCDPSKKLYIVEGIFDKLSFEKTQRQCVAALSNKLHRDQLFHLRKFKHIVLVPDNDIHKKDEGLYLIQTSLPLQYHTKLSVCILPTHRKDAGECEVAEILEATYQEIPIQDFLVSERYLSWARTHLISR